MTMTETAEGVPILIDKHAKLGKHIPKLPKSRTLHPRRFMGYLEIRTKPASDRVAATIVRFGICDNIVTKQSARVNMPIELDEFGVPKETTGHWKDSKFDSAEAAVTALEAALVANYRRGFHLTSQHMTMVPMNSTDVRNLEDKGALPRWALTWGRNAMAKEILAANESSPLTSAAPVGPPIGGTHVPAPGGPIRTAPATPLRSGIGVTSIPAKPEWEAAWDDGEDDATTEEGY